MLWDGRIVGELYSTRNFGHRKIFDKEDRSHDKGEGGPATKQQEGLV